MRGLRTQFKGVSKIYHCPDTDWFSFNVAMTVHRAQKNPILSLRQVMFKGEQFTVRPNQTTYFFNYWSKL